MEAAVVTTYETALPDDPRVVRKQMFGSPCAFVNRQMFFGTFEDTLVARIGPERVSEIVDQPGMQPFAPTEGRVWSDYVQLDPTVDPQLLAELATEALAWAAALPRKGKRPKK
jgi:TfoX/Sxy family transcriptional regulator of competence genes